MAPEQQTVEVSAPKSWVCACLCVCAGVSVEVLGVCVLGECVSVCVHGSLSGSPGCVCPG